MAAHAAHAFTSPPPVARLVNAFDEPYNNAVATARTCYTSRVVTAADVRRDARAMAQRDAIAQSTFAAGHHTTLQHAHFQFALENVSRQLIWSFLHAHPFYNSEQVSQRYVAVRPGTALVPSLPPRAAAAYAATVDAQMACYRDLVDLLRDAVAAAYFAVFPARRKHAETYRKAIDKRAQEIARYALPVSTQAHLYHTISGLTLHRYRRLCGMLEVGPEASALVEAMAQAVQAHDPLFFAQLQDPLALEDTHEFGVLAALGEAPGLNGDARAFCAAFDAQLGGRASCLVDTSAAAEAHLARAVRLVLGLPADRLDDATAIDYVLSAAHNPYLSEALNLTSMGKLTRAMGHVHYTFAKKLSHTADSQDQRHRLTPGVRPLLARHYAPGSPDVVVPSLLGRVPAALDRFMATMQATWSTIDRLLDDQVAPQLALYLLPNAFPIRFEASGDLAGWHHKWTKRLCYTAQEEIWQASVDEVRAVAQVHPRIARHLEAPCGLRREAGARPLCPEGTRYCGVPVWKQAVSDYARVI